MDKYVYPERVRPQILYYDEEKDEMRDFGEIVERHLVSFDVLENKELGVELSAGETHEIEFEDFNQGKKIAVLVETSISSNFTVGVIYKVGSVPRNVKGEEKTVDAKSGVVYLDIAFKDFNIYIKNSSSDTYSVRGLAITAIK